MENNKQTAEELLKFLDKSVSVFHAIDTVKSNLLDAGFEELKEENKWSIQKDGKYFVVRNDSSIIAMHIPTRNPKGFHIVATHGDFPCFKLKEKPEMGVDEKYIKLNTEPYGGMIMSTWMDRPLSIAGRIAVEVDGKIQTRLVQIEEDLLVIPSMAIHMNREANKGMEYNAQVDMLPLFACKSEDQEKVLDKIAAAANVEIEDILGHDLFLYTRDKGRMLGANGEFILAPRLDDLMCVHSSIQAFVETIPNEYITVCAVFDNEEVGSGTMQGADSTFLEDTLSRIVESTYGRELEYKRLLADSFLISADNAHALHPNHPEKADPTNKPYINGGVVIKFHGSQKYTTDAVSAATIKLLCKKADVPYQTYTNRSDMAGGSTLGNISTSHVSIPSADIGLPQLAMHSAMETAGVKDLQYAVDMFKVFYAE